MDNLEMPVYNMCFGGLPLTLKACAGFWDGSWTEYLTVLCVDIEQKETDTEPLGLGDVG